MMKTVKVAFLGHGNVCGGACYILKNNKDLIESRIQKRIEINHILVSDATKQRKWPTLSATLTTNFEDILDSDTDIVVEALGGINPASLYMEKCLDSGKHVITANKAALASSYEKLSKLSASSNCQLLFEAAVGGGIPAISAILGNLSGNKFTEISGILNGTSNFILSKMKTDGSSYNQVLKQAQELGFAEADPTADVEGIDSANKLSILIAIAFDEYIRPEDIPTIGISKITENDIKAASDEGKKIKLIASAKVKNNKKSPSLEYFVKPVIIDARHPLYGVDNEYNGILVKGDAVEDVMMYGKGAGPLPTGSAIVGDILKIAERL
ncbi:homoserine dehydrogenase [Eubacteriales bacterium KG127]